MVTHNLDINSYGLRQHLIQYHGQNDTHIDQYTAEHTYGWHLDHHSHFNINIAVSSFRTPHPSKYHIHPYVETTWMNK